MHSRLRTCALTGALRQSRRVKRRREVLIEDGAVVFCYTNGKNDNRIIELAQTDPIEVGLSRGMVWFICRGEG